MTSSNPVGPVRDRRLVDQAGVRFGIGGAGLFLVTAAIAAANLPDPWGVAALLVTTVVLASPLTAGYAFPFGVAGWAFSDGFALHRYGELGFGVPEVLMLAGFVVAAVLAACAARPAIE